MERERERRIEWKTRKNTRNSKKGREELNYRMKDTLAKLFYIYFEFENSNWSLIVISFDTK